MRLFFSFPPFCFLMMKCPRNCTDDLVVPKTLKVDDFFVLLLPSPNFCDWALKNTPKVEYITLLEKYKGNVRNISGYHSVPADVRSYAEKLGETIESYKIKMCFFRRSISTISINRVKSVAVNYINVTINNQSSGHGTKKQKIRTKPKHCGPLILQLCPLFIENSL